jgi:hypothetical protein
MMPQVVYAHGEKVVKFHLCTNSSLVLDEFAGSPAAGTPCHVCALGWLDVSHPEWVILRGIYHSSVIRSQEIREPEDKRMLVDLALKQNSSWFGTEQTRKE